MRNYIDLWNNPATPLLMLNQQVCAIDLAQSYESIFVMGDSGSGKTSAVMASLAHAYLARGQYGMLVCTVKGDEADLWQKHAAAAGRAADVVRFSIDSGHEWNLFQYITDTFYSGDSDIFVDLCMNIIEASGRQSASGNDESFWPASLRQLLTNSTEVELAATGKASLEGVREIIQSAPQTREEARSRDWQENSLCFRHINQAAKRELPPDRRYDAEAASTYFLEEFASLSLRTKSIVLIMATQFFDTFLRGRLRRIFTGAVSIKPEWVAEGAILILDFPVLHWGERGKFIQQAFVYCLMKYIERRNIITSPRPIAIVEDELQHLVLPRAAARFASISRGLRASCIAATQNLPNLYRALGHNESAKWDTLGLLANHKSKFFTANSDNDSNTYVSELIGKEWTARINTGLNSAPVDTAGALFGQSQQGHSLGASESLEAQLLASELKRLKTGGPRFHNRVEAIFVQSGRTWPSGKDYVRLTFEQSGL